MQAKLLAGSLAIGSVLTAASSTTPVRATSTDDVQVDGEKLDLSSIAQYLDYSDEDVKFAELAAAESDSDNTVDDILIQNALVAVANEVERVFPDEYATASVSRGELTIGFRDDAPKGLVETIEDVTGISVNIETYLGTSERAINQALSDGFDVVRRLPGVVNASGGYDVHSLTLEYFVELANGYSVDGLADRLPAVEPFDVLISSVNEALGSDDSVQGGGRLEFAGSVELACTTGFVIQKGAQQGFVTAGHCSDGNLTYEDWSGQQETAVGSQDVEYISNLGDMQIHLFDSASQDNFYKNDQHVLQDVSTVQTPVNGIDLCRYGSKTGLECDEVYAQGHCKVVQGNTVCNLTMMNNDEAEVGDSGGPWFSGGSAYGIHQGSKTWYFQSRDVFTRASNFNLAFGGIIRT
jgi:streptogrisin C